MMAAIGPCPFTNDPLTHLMIENTPHLRFENAQEVSLDLSTAHSLAEQFLVTTSGTLDLFDPQWLISEVSAWVEHRSLQSEPRSAIVHLVLGIGAQGRAQNETDELVAEQCFAYGRKLAMFTLMDDPSLSTIQAFALITYYMFAACRRNAAFTNMGVAVRAAYTLGIHLHEANNAFAQEEKTSRERAWKSLRVCDFFLSASLGRPPATSGTFCNIPSATPEQTSNTEAPNVDSQISSAIFRICNVMERILVEVYSKKAITLELAKSISKEHRQWTEALPQMLKIDGLEGSGSESACWSAHVAKHGSRIVMMAYYYSIVLLTRPFLTFRVRSAKRQSMKRDDASARADLITYADACVNSAIKGIDMAHEDVFDEGAPRRQPLVINSVFISALCLGLAYLGDYDRQRWPLSPSLDRAISILTHLGQLNPQSTRQAEICRLLKDAIASYVSSRDDTLLQSQCLSVRNVFGDVRVAPESEGLARKTPDAIAMQTPSETVRESTDDSGGPENISHSLFDFMMLQQESIIPTSDTWPVYASSEQNHDYPDIAMVAQDFINANTFNSLHASTSEQDVLLFSLTNGFPSDTYS
jgi:hypothetical protein